MSTRTGTAGAGGQPSTAGAGGTAREAQIAHTELGVTDEPNPGETPASLAVD